MTLRLLVAVAFGACVLTALPSRAAAASAPAEAKSEPIKVKPTEAKEHVGQVVIVEATVSGLKEFNGGLVLLNLDGNFPNQALTAVVKAEDAKTVGDVKKYDGKKVRIRGEVVMFNKRPEVVIKTPDAITAE